MKTKKIIYFILMYLPLVAALIALQYLPSKIPAHYGFDNQITRWGNKYKIAKKIDKTLKGHGKIPASVLFQIKTGAAVSFYAQARIWKFAAGAACGPRGE